MSYSLSGHPATMSNMLRNWISSVVVGNLAGALRDARNIEISDLEVRKGNYVYHRDRIVMNVRENRTAQIIEVKSLTLSSLRMLTG